MQAPTGPLTIVLPLQSIMLSYLPILYTAAVSNLGLAVFSLAWATSRTALCDFIDAVMCGGGYATLVTDWCYIVCSGGYMTGDRKVLCCGGCMTGDRLVMCGV